MLLEARNLHIGYGDAPAVWDVSLDVGAGEIVMKPIREAFPSLVLAADHRPHVDIVPAQLGNDAGAIGAALIGFDRQ